jgi:hypothetical protein
LDEGIFVQEIYDQVTKQSHSQVGNRILFSVRKFKDSDLRGMQGQLRACRIGEKSIRVPGWALEDFIKKEASGSKKAASARGKAIAAARKKSGNNTDWKKVFSALDKKRGK